VMRPVWRAVRFAATWGCTVTLCTAGLLTAGAPVPATAGERVQGGIQCPVPYQYMIPGSAHIAGLGGTTWVSDLVVYNLGEAEAGVEAYFLKRDTDNAAATGTFFLVDAGSSLLLGDVVWDFFGESSTSGAIFICSDQPLMVSSRTYNDAPSGTYGQHIGGSPVLTGIPGDHRAYLFQLTRNDDFRTNIGFANALPSQLELDVTLHDAQGAELKTVQVSVPPHGFVQKTDILGSDVPDAYAIVKATTSEARYFAYASIIDNHTGDPTFVTPEISFFREDSTLYLPAAAHVDGYGGTHWRTDVELLNLSTWATDTVVVKLLARDQANPAPPSKEYVLPPKTSLRISDVLETVFGFSGAAALRFECSSSAIAVSSRTFNQTAAGTYGQFVPAVPASATVGAGDSVVLAQLATSASASEGFRTNIGILNTSGNSIVVVVELKGEDGTKLGERSVSLGPYEFTQMDKIFQGIVAGTRNNLTARLHTASAGGSFIAYASVVDNRSGDPVFVPAQRREPMIPGSIGRMDIPDAASFISRLDVDADGDEDLVMALAAGGIRVRILEQGQPTDLEMVAGSGSYDCVGGRLDATGTAHLAGGNAQGIDLFTRTQGTWSQPTHVDVAHTVKRVAVVDLDLDGDLDLVVALEGSFTGGSELALAVLRNDGAGYSLEILQDDFLASEIACTKVGDLQITDFNGDSYPDPVMSGRGRAYVLWELSSDGTGAFNGSKGTGTGYEALASGDFDGDGAMDLAATGVARVDLYPGASTGDLSTSRRIFRFPGNWDFGHGLDAVNLVDGNGAMELVGGGSSREIVLLARWYGRAFAALPFGRSEGIIQQVLASRSGGVGWVAARTDTHVFIWRPNEP